MVGFIGRLVDCQRPLVVRPRPLQVPEGPKHCAEVVEVNGHLGMVGLVGLWVFRGQAAPDFQSLLVGPLGLAQPLGVAVEDGQVVEGPCQTRPSPFLPKK